MSTRNTPGLVYVYTGHGKGKTSAAFGQVVRGLGHGWNVGLIAWYKEASWELSEYQFSQLLTSEAQSRLQLLRLGKGFFIKQPSRELVRDEKVIKIAKANDATIVDDHSQEEHREAAKAALSATHTLLKEWHPDLLILDEVCNALADTLLSWSDLQALLEKRGSTHCVLTGRSALPELIEYADLVSEVKMIKHPYEKGQLAVPGLDF